MLIFIFVFFRYESGTLEETLEQPRSLESQQSSIYVKEKSSLKAEESYDISKVTNELVKEPDPTTVKPVSLKVTEKKITFVLEGKAILCESRKLGNNSSLPPFQPSTLWRKQPFFFL